MDSGAGRSALDTPALTSHPGWLRRPAPMDRAPHIAQRAVRRRRGVPRGPADAPSLHSSSSSARSLSSTHSPRQARHPFFFRSLLDAPARLRIAVQRGRRPIDAAHHGRHHGRFQRQAGRTRAQRWTARRHDSALPRNRGGRSPSARRIRAEGIRGQHHGLSGQSIRGVKLGNGKLCPSESGRSGSPGEHSVGGERNGQPLRAPPCLPGSRDPEREQF